MKDAYVWLLMLGDRYLPGVLTSAYSLRRSKTNKELVCMITHDVSEYAIKELNKVLDKVIKVPYIENKSRKLISKKQNEIYDWIDKSYTKWNCLNLFQYRKVMIMDADIIVLHNIDHLFDLQAPAGIFESAWVKTPDSYQGRGKLQNGDKISREDIMKNIYNYGHVACASCMLLEPSKEQFFLFQQMLQEMVLFGFPCHNGFDEQSIAYFMSLYPKGPKKDWRFIHQKYTHMIWKEDWLAPNEEPYVLHYFGKKKPWEVQRDEWPDLEVWYTLANEMVNKHKCENKGFLFPRELMRRTKGEDRYVKILTKT